jgi:hypothetical protein
LRVQDDWRAIDGAKHYRFYDYTSNPVYNAKKVIYEDVNISFDLGQSWEVLAHN